MTKEESLLLELIQAGLGIKNKISHVPSSEEWSCLFKLSQIQAVAGVVFSALDKLSRTDVKPPMSVLYNWIGIVEQIKQQNKIVNQNAVNLCKMLANDGFECCILKGQGNNLLYPDTFSRQPGDIDVWIRDGRRIRNATLCSAEKKDTIKGVVRYVKERNPEGNALYHHIDYGQFQGTEVEVHYKPSFMFYPMHNWRLQRWFLEKADEQFCHDVDLPEEIGKIHVPTAEFNVIFQLSHVYNHLLHEGIGLRQIVDYFYVLHAVHNVELAYYKCSGILRYLGLEKIAGAMMWLLHEKLGLPEEYLIAPMDEQRGKVLLEEIMRGGNFGYYDKNNIKATSRLKKNILRLKRDLRMMRHFPSECLWEPVFRVYHLFWRMRYN